MCCKPTHTCLFIGILMPAMRAIVSTLSLLVALVAADHVDHAPTAHDLAVLADLFNGWTYFHEDVPEIRRGAGSAARPCAAIAEQVRLLEQTRILVRHHV